MRVLVASATRLERELMTSELERHGLDVIGSTASSDEALESARIHRPDIALLDGALGGEGCLVLTRRIVREALGVRPMLVVRNPLRVQACHALAAGAAAYLPLRVSTDELVAAIRSVAEHRGRSPLPGMFPETALTDEPLLTHMQLRVLQAMANHGSTKQAAKDLDLAVKTVHTHLGSVYRRLDVTDRTSAVIVGVRLGLVVISGVGTTVGPSPGSAELSGH